MKTGILTHPFRGNYGGMLQGYALQQALLRLGIEAPVLDYSYPHELVNQAKKEWLLPARLRALQVRLGLATASTTCPLALMQLSVANQFLRKHVRFERVMLPLTSSSPIQQYDCWIVGSDQVWRAEYSRHMAPFPFFFLDFASESVRHRSVAYAASFGLDMWQGTPEETNICAPLLRQFLAVSVREHSGIELCRTHFGVTAEQMADPTLLLSAQDYDKLIAKERTWRPSEPYAAVYVLDDSKETSETLRQYHTESGLYLQHLMPHPMASRMRDRVPCRVTQWLRYIRDARCVITDSFHGCVFAVIFNKPFVCLGNQERGMSRFDSFLSRYHLMSRLAVGATGKGVQDTLSQPIDWAAVNQAIAADVQRAYAWLRRYVNADK